MCKLGLEAAKVRKTGRQLPFIVNLALAYLLLDTLSTRVDGPVDIIEAHTYELDGKIRVFHRVEHLVAEAAPLVGKAARLLVAA